ETQAYDHLNSRLVITSHSGQIKMFSLKKANLKHLWTVNTSGVVPRAALFFGGANQSLLTFGLENGEMCCREAQNSNVLWKKTLAGGMFTKQCAFTDGAKIAVCGSDSNKVYIMDVTTGECLQTLTSGKGLFQELRDMTQTVAATSANGGQITCGSTGGTISLFQKEVSIFSTKESNTTLTLTVGGGG
ncbi:hypothetical protein BYT27DRAFT_7094729, partial [Phlegmacium glaucopus]